MSADANVYERAVWLVGLRRRNLYTRRSLERALQTDYAVAAEVAHRAVGELLVGGALEMRVDPDASQRRRIKRVFLGARSVEGALLVAAQRDPSLLTRERAHTRDVRVRTGAVAVAPAHSRDVPPSGPHVGDVDARGRVRTERGWRHQDSVVSAPVEVRPGANPVPIEQRGMLVDGTGWATAMRRGRHQGTAFDSRDDPRLPPGLR